MWVSPDLSEQARAALATAFALGWGLFHGKVWKLWLRFALCRECRCHRGYRVRQSLPRLPPMFNQTWKGLRLGFAAITQHPQAAAVNTGLGWQGAKRWQRQLQQESSAVLQPVPRCGEHPQPQGQLWACQGRITEQEKMFKIWVQL